MRVDISGKAVLILLVTAMFASFPLPAQSLGKEHPVEHVTSYRSVRVDDLSIFCR